jgi:hypothetical protein
MAIDVNKLIADTKAAQETARKNADEAARLASKDKATAKVAALSKKQLDYANSLKPTLAEYEAGLRNFARKIGLGDKLSEVEQKEFSRLQSNYKSLNKTIDSAIKKANDILVEARRKVAANPPVSPKTQTDAGGPTGTPAIAPSLQPKPKLDEKPKTPTTGGGKGGGTTGKEVPSGFNVGSFRKDDEASMTNVGGITPPTGTAVKSSLDTLLAKTDFWYDLPDYIFKIDVDPKTGGPGEIGRLLQEAVAGDWKNDKFLSKLQLTKWWQRNAPQLRDRIINREKYNDLLKAGEDVSKTEYGLYLSKQIRAVKAKAQELAGVTLTDEQAQSVAQKIYDGFLDDDPLAINALIVPFIGKTTSIVGTGTGQTGFSGQALQNYQMLQDIAKKNGFSLKDILPNISAITAGGDLETAVLRGLADGSIDINRVAQDARMLAAQGQPQYVRNLLGQGYDLEAVYAPYRKTMATELELDPNAIDLNDATLRMAITDKGDMNLYDFKKALRQDNRWQYTGTAKEEVSNAALGVLRDFGFQG